MDLIPDPGADVVTGQQIAFFVAVIVPAIFAAVGLLMWLLVKLGDWYHRKYVWDKKCTHCGSKLEGKPVAERIEGTAAVRYEA